MILKTVLLGGTSKPSELFSKHYFQEPMLGKINTVISIIKINMMKGGWSIVAMLKLQK